LEDAHAVGQETGVDFGISPKIKTVTQKRMIPDKVWKLLREKQVAGALDRCYGLDTP